MRNDRVEPTENGTTYILKAYAKDRFGRDQELYWEGHDWTPQMWDAAHFDTRAGLESFIKDHCGPAMEGGWQFYVVPVNFGDS